MAKRNMTDKLIDKSEIQEELRLIKGSLTDYITPSGETCMLVSFSATIPKPSGVNIIFTSTVNFFFLFLSNGTISAI